MNFYFSQGAYYKLHVYSLSEEAFLWIWEVNLEVFIQEEKLWLTVEILWKKIQFVLIY